MTGQSNEAQWYIARDGKQHGPLTDVEMRTFVGHSYLRPSDLLWRPGMSDWQPAPIVFPEAFQAPQQQQPAPQQPVSQQPVSQQPVQHSAPAGQAAHHPQSQSYGHGANPAAGGAQQGGYAQQGASGQQANIHRQTAQAPLSAGGQHDTYEEDNFDDEPGRPSRIRQAAIALLLVCLIGGSAFAIVSYKDDLMQLISGPPAPQSEATQSTAAATEPHTEAPQAAPAEPVQSAEAQPETGEDLPPDPAMIEGSALDARLQKIPVWTILKKEYPDWYITRIAAADKLAAENKSQLDISTQLVQGLVELRRQKAPNALAASPERLRGVASAFLENLRALQAQSVGACYGYISKGELSPGVIEIMQTPENATTMNAQLAAIFEAAVEGAKSPVQHQPTVKADYDVLVAELGKLGWKAEDVQIFSNPRLLAKREPAQVCRMVQDWFSAHLAVSDPAVQDRLLYETLMPVVTG